MMGTPLNMVSSSLQPSRPNKRKTDGPVEEWDKNAEENKECQLCCTEFDEQEHFAMPFHEGPNKCNTRACQQCYIKIVHRDPRCPFCRVDIEM
jgi:hypothetical protein